MKMGDFSAGSVRRIPDRSRTLRDTLRAITLRHIPTSARCVGHNTKLGDISNFIKRFTKFNALKTLVLNGVINMQVVYVPAMAV